MKEAAPYFDIQERHAIYTKALKYLPHIVLDGGGICRSIVSAIGHYGRGNLKFDQYATVGLYHHLDKDFLELWELRPERYYDPDSFNWFKPGELKNRQQILEKAIELTKS